MRILSIISILLLLQEMLIIYKSASLGEDWTPAREQVVIAVDEKDGDVLLKRVIGLEGEHIKIEHGKIYINDKLHKDPWTYQDITYWLESKKEREGRPEREWLFFNAQENVGIVPKGYVWVIGDNRRDSWMGFVKIKEIKGWVLF